MASAHSHVEVSWAVHCRICGNNQGNRSFEPREMMFGLKESFDYFQCSACDCLQITDIPSDMARYYPAEYYSYEASPRRTRVRRFFARLKHEYAVFGARGPFGLGEMLYSRRPELGLFSLQLLDVDPDKRILDVGCGSGALLQSLRSLGFQELMGVDPFIRSEIEYESGLRISKRAVEDVDGVWDVVMFHHSFEHLPDPKATLLSVHRLLDDGGCCLIRIPTVSSFAWQHYAIHWAQLDAPRHFFLHSTRSMEILAERADFDILGIRYDSTDFQFWGSEQILQGIALNDARSYAVNPRKSIFSKQVIATWAARAEELNQMRQGDQAAFYLRKKPAGR